MRIKKISAPNLSEGKILIKRELGEEAVILSTRNVKDKETGNTQIEIVAAIDEPAQQAKSNNSTVNIKQNVVDETLTNLVKSANLPLLKYLPRELRDNYSFLKKIGFNELFISNLFEELSEKSNTKLSNDDLLNYLISKIKIENLFEKKLARKIYGFVGPSGVGKTTSLLKFAMTHKILHSSRIMIIGSDNYNFGAIELLSSYCKALELEFTKSNTKEELEGLISKYKNYDLILIDFDSHSKIYNSQIENILVLPINANIGFLNNQLAKYSNSYVAFTGLDEKFDIQTIISLIIDKNLKLCFYTNGTKIPDDIELLNSSSLKKMVVGNE